MMALRVAKRHPVLLAGVIGGVCWAWMEHADLAYDSGGIAFYLWLGNQLLGIGFRISAQILSEVNGGLLASRPIAAALVLGAAFCAGLDYMWGRFWGALRPEGGGGGPAT